MKYGELNLGQIEAIVNKLGGMDGVRRFLSGELMVEMAKHTINCDAEPFTPSGWKVEEHKKGGQFAFDPAKIKLYLSPNQQDGEVIGGNELRKEMASEPVLNANVLDYLLAHPELIPEDWKKDEQGKTRYVFFWGTIYRYSSGYLCVRSLYWGGGSWGWSGRWLDGGWRGVDPAAVLAS